MKNLTVSGDFLLNEKTSDIDLPKGVYRLHLGDGELVGVSINPGIARPDPLPTGLSARDLEREMEKRQIMLYCRDVVPIITLDRSVIIKRCSDKIQEKKDLGIEFLQAHYSNMVEVNFKFKQQLLISGNIKGFWFYFQVKK